MVIAGSDFVAENPAPWSTKRVQVVRYGAPALTWRDVNAADNGPLKVLFAGQANQRKGIGYLLEVMARLGERVELRVAGDAGALVRERALPMANVQLLGPLSSAALQLEYRKADVLALPSLAEGFALVALEAMAAGLPCILTESTGVGEPVTDRENGLIVRVGDAAALGELLASLDGDRRILSDVSRRAQQLVSQLTWDDFGRHSAAVILELIGDK
ncbi:glycosyltransferase family 4 protein [Microbacterium sp. zg-YB36]|uniref:glycosyltransferase family 4 protein n=1 Tax=Microbacterium sp. zg-YB36 TaxID=2969407 RepID=UPI00214CF79F|nr:glycosyltransferase family 4 protein [Microbacterium sp. zg-YB36]MDL5352325.1 glycosyltransferase family 4 protein [Microbacterium sp. zg-YB36]